MALKLRIDMRVRDVSYSIIIENKIHGAKEQHKQIDRYIENENNDTRYNMDENIYVIYLTASGGGPTVYSFADNLKQNFEAKSAYRELSYKKEILDWLKSIVENKDIEKEYFLENALRTLRIINRIICLKCLKTQN